jgi:hypothetical protein
MEMVKVFSFFSSFSSFFIFFLFSCFLSSLFFSSSFSFFLSTFLLFLPLSLELSLTAFLSLPNFSWAEVLPTYEASPSTSLGKSSNSSSSCLSSPLAISSHG